MDLSNSWILLVGSAAPGCDFEDLRRAHRFIDAFVAEVLVAGGGFVVLLGEEPASHHHCPLPTIWDGAVLRAVARFVEGDAAPPRRLLRVVTARKFVAGRMPKDNLALVQRLNASEHAEVVTLADELYTGGRYRDQQMEWADGVVVLSGGKGSFDVTHRARSRNQPVLPLDLDLGSAAGDAHAARDLHRSFVAAPKDYFPLTHTSVREQHLDLFLSSPSSDPTAVARRAAKMFAQEFGAKFQSSPDVVVLTMLPVELQAAAAAFGLDLNSPQVMRDGVRGWHSQLTNQGGRRLSILVCTVGDAGNVSAATVLGGVLGAISKPKLLCLIGIAAGDPERTALGECVIAEQVMAYEPGSLVAGDVQRRPKMWDIPQAERQALVPYLACHSAYRARVAAAMARADVRWPTPRDGDRAVVEPKVKKVMLASGEKLVRDAAFWGTLRSSHEKVSVVEMEAHGFVAVAAASNLRWVVVRGISDFGDSGKNDDYHEVAATVAAETLRDFLEHGFQV